MLWLSRYANSITYRGALKLPAHPRLAPLDGLMAGLRNPAKLFPGYNLTGVETLMKNVPKLLMILAAIGIGIGLVVRLVQSFSGVVRLAFLDPVFYWRGGMALLMFAAVILLVQIRDGK